MSRLQKNPRKIVDFSTSSSVKKCLNEMIDWDEMGESISVAAYFNVPPDLKSESG